MKNINITINYTHNGYEICKLTSNGLQLLDIKQDLEQARASQLAYIIAGV